MLMVTLMSDDNEPLGNGDKRWHINKGVPVAFIVSMLIYAITQTATAAWFASAMAQRMDVNEKAVFQLSQQVMPQGERLTRVEERLTAVQTGITDIKALLQAPSKVR